MMMSRFLTRPQLCRVTRWVQSQRFPSSTVTNDPSSKVQRKWPEHVVPLTCRSSASSGFCQVYLVGSSNFSQSQIFSMVNFKNIFIGNATQKSCAEVQEIISSLKPEVVFLELCSNRQGVLKQQKVASKHKTMRMRGSDFRVAYEEAAKYGGWVFLGDRPMQITLMRAWRKMPLSEKARFLFCLFGKGSSHSSNVLHDLHKWIDCDIDMDMVTHVKQVINEIFPTFVETVLHERDLYMSSKLLEVAKKSKCVVAVVGKEHLQGIKKHWEQPILVKDLLKIPLPAMSSIILSCVGFAVVSMIWGY